MFPLQNFLNFFQQFQEQLLRKFVWAFLWKIPECLWEILTAIQLLQELLYLLQKKSCIYRIFFRNAFRKYSEMSSRNSTGIFLGNLSASYRRKLFFLNIPTISSRTLLWVPFRNLQDITGEVSLGFEKQKRTNF